MRIEAEEPIMFRLQKDPLALAFENASGEAITFPLTIRTAQELAMALLSITEVGRDFDCRAEEEVIRRLNARHAAAAN